MVNVRILGVVNVLLANDSQSVGGPLNILPLTLYHVTPKFHFGTLFGPDEVLKIHLAPFLDQLSVSEQKIFTGTVPLKVYYLPLRSL